jgi:transglutaminase-like putative cysteine protease
MHYLIEHETRLEFPESIREHHCELRVVPHNHGDQRIHAVRIDVEPGAEMFRYTDCFGNVVHHFAVIEAHDTLLTRVEISVETSLENPFDYQPIAPRRERAWTLDALHTQPRLWDFVLHRSPAVPDLAPFAADHEFPRYDPDRALVESVRDAATWVRDNFVYDAAATEVHSALAEVLELRAGVCQDFAHLLIAVVRSWGFPARYVMGYQDPGYLRGAEQATHAWAEVLIPGAGWRGFDATNGLLADHTYVRVAVGRDYGDAAPQRGSFKGDGDGDKPHVSLRVVRQQ